MSIDPHWANPTEDFAMWIFVKQLLSKAHQPLGKRARVWNTHSLTQIFSAEKNSQVRISVRCWIKYVTKFMSSLVGLFVSTRVLCVPKRRRERCLSQTGKWNIQQVSATRQQAGTALPFQASACTFSSLYSRHLDCSFQVSFVCWLALRSVSWNRTGVFISEKLQRLTNKALCLDFSHHQFHLNWFLPFCKF